MYELGAQRIGVAPAECVFVDDLAFNLDPARELGMAVVHHTSAATTLAELERLVGLAQRRERIIEGSGVSGGPGAGARPAERARLGTDRASVVTPLGAPLGVCALDPR